MISGSDNGQVSSGSGISLKPVTSISVPDTKRNSSEPPSITLGSAMLTPVSVRYSIRRSVGASEPVLRYSATVWPGLNRRANGEGGRRKDRLRLAMSNWPTKLSRRLLYSLRSFFLFSFKLLKRSAFFGKVTGPSWSCAGKSSDAYYVRWAPYASDPTAKQSAIRAGTAP